MGLAYIWRRCCLREWVYSIWRDTRQRGCVFFVSFALGPSVDSDGILHFQALMLWSIQMLMRAERGDSHINLICPWIAACVCPDLSTARRHTHTHTHILSFSPSLTYSSALSKRNHNRGLLIYSLFHFFMFCLFFLINWMFVLTWSLILTDSGNLK